jgi:putative ABC transport system substrate-binding protein
LIVALGAGACGLPFPSGAQQPGNLRRIGLLWIESDPSSSRYVATLRDGLRALGYVEGKNVLIDDHSLVDRYELLAEAAARLVGQKVDIIICWGATALQAVSKATSTIPIVMVSSGDPVKLGVAASLSKPGGNVTGTSSISQELSGKRLELLKEVVPGLRRLAVILYPDSAAEARALKSYEAAARALNIEVRTVEIRTTGDIGPVIADITQMNVQAIAAVGSTLLTANSKQVVAAVERIRIPAIYANLDFARSGGLMAYAPNLSDHFLRAATYVDKIFKGAKPGDLPIEQPTRVELVINLKTAKALGVVIPRSLTLRADELIQ